MARTTVFLPLAVILLSCEVAGNDEPAPQPVEPVTLDCGPEGFLATEMFGALTGKISWDATALVCEGMARPGGDGARLRFAGTVGSEFEIAFIIAIPDLKPGETGKEFRSKVTVIEEGAGRFFSNADQDNCWTDVNELQPLNESATRFAIDGALYCVSPLIEINGETEITLGDLSFRGLLDWEAS